MNPVELSSVAAVVPEAADHAAILALQNADFIVLAVGIQEPGLLGVGPDRKVPHRTVAERVLLVEPFLDEGAVLLEHLDAVLGAIADIDEAVIGDFHAVHGIAELLLRRRLGIIRRLLVIIGRIAVGAPVPLIGARRSVVDNNAAIAVAVGDVEFVDRLVDRGLGGLAELGGVITAGARRDLADLHHELAVEGEFQKHVVVVGVAADPDKAALVDLNAVLAADPFIAFAGSAPGAQEIAGGIEFENRRRRHAAFRARW